MEYRRKCIRIYIISMLENVFINIGDNKISNSSFKTKVLPPL